MDKTILRTEEREKIVYEFDAFRVDPIRRLLSRDGEPVQVTPKALSILVALLERPGDVVDKRDLIEKVWPGTNVTEANLTQNVFSLRKSLGERANENRYVVTVPGLGYSFAGKVRRIERLPTSEIPIWVDPPEVAADAGVDVDSGAEPAVFVGEPLPVALPPPVGRPALRRSSLLAVAGMLVAVMALGAGLFEFLHLAGDRRSPGAEQRRPVRPAIAVLEFKCLSPGGASRWLQTALTEMLTTELASSGAMRVIQGEVVAQTLRSLGIQDTTQPGPAELKRLREALGVDFVVVGSYLALGEKIRLNLRVLEVPEGSTVASVPQDGIQPQLFELVSRTGTELRKELGITAPSPRQIRETRALAPSNPTAQRFYAQGLERLRAYDPPGARDLLQQAVAADPSSAVIHSALAQAWSILGYDLKSEQEARKALDLAGSLSLPDRLAIEGLLYRIDKQWDRASETYRSLWTFHPDDVEHGLKLADSLVSGGHAAEAAETLATLRKLPPPAGLDPRIDLVAGKVAYRLSDSAAHLQASRTAEQKGRKSGQTVVVAQALISEGNALQGLGRPREAIPLYREAARLAEKAGYLFGVGRAKANLGEGLQMIGDLDGAQSAGEEALAVARQTGSAMGIAWQLYTLGQLRRYRGELAAALSLLDQARDQFVKIGDRFNETEVLNVSGEALVAMGDLAAARKRFERALALSRDLENRAAEARTLDRLGTVLGLQGDLGEARRHHEQAAAILGRAGEPSLAAVASAAAAEAAARLGGNLQAAWQSSSQALAMKRQSGDRIGAGKILGSQAWLAYARGDFAASRQLAGEQLQIARETGARSLNAWGLQNLGRADFAAGDLAAARVSLAKALAESTSLGEGLRGMEIRLDLARLALARGQAGEAAALAGEAATWCRARGIRGRQAQASALLAQALARQGRLREAGEAATLARERLADIQDREIRNAITVSLARCAKAIDAGAPPAVARVPVSG